MKKRRTAAILAAGLLIGAAVAGTFMMMRYRQADLAERNTEFHTELFGENTYIFTPQDDPELVQQTLRTLYDKQEANQFGEERYAVYFMPGEYDDSIQAEVGFYTQIAGLGRLPTDTRIAHLECLARWLGEDESNHNACCNFWRSVENLTIGSNTTWAVSQATDMRRVQIEGALYLHDDYGWCSGGFLADSNITSMVDSGSQQQWLSRNNNWKCWMGDNWNMVFVGEKEGCAPKATWPVSNYTAIDTTPAVREKPFLVYDEAAGYGVCVPQLRENTDGISWENAAEERVIPISEFYVAKPKEDTADSINAALQEGKNLLFTPGIYRLDQAIQINRADTVVLGTGLATLESTDGNSCMELADEDGILVAGLLFDAGGKESENLLAVGAEGSLNDHSKNPICLSDLYFRVGGTQAEQPAVTKTCVTINSSHVIGDNFWVWRADHGDNVAWDENTAANGIIVNGEDVTMYALMVEHFLEYQTVWNGDNGSVYMYQSEIPYDVPNQEAWKSHDGTVNGYASFKVADEVQSFEAYGLGIYLYNRDMQVELNSAMEMPDRDGVRVQNICTVMLNGYPGMKHIINESGKSVNAAGERQILLEYENKVSR